MSRILITGAGGFVGANLLRALIERGDEVHAIIRTKKAYWRISDLSGKFQSHYADLANVHDVRNILAAVKPEVVYHLAHFGGNRGEIDSASIRSVIIDGTANLYTACAEHGVGKIVHTGSSSEYGHKSEPMSESMLLEPNTEYGLAKTWATLYGEHLRREQGLNITTLRLFSVYGPYESAQRFFPATVKALLSSGLPTLSNPKTVRDFIYIDDVVQALLLAETGPAGIFNIGTGIESTLGDAVKMIQMIVKHEAPVVWGDQDGRSFDTNHWVADTELSKSQLHFTASTKLEDGIIKFISWFKEHQHLYV